MEVGRELIRVDAVDKVTGRAKYTDDFHEGPYLIAKILHATIGNGMVKSIDTSEAEKLRGVVKVLTCFDAPDIQYPTPGHPWSVEAAHQDVSDRRLLTQRVRIYGDDIAVVVAEDNVIAERALRLIRVTFEEWPVELDPEKSMVNPEHPIHEEHPDNILKHTVFKVPTPGAGVEGVDEVFTDSRYRHFKGSYQTQAVQHCHIENPISYAYMEHGRITVVSSTQIPHIVRRVCGQALGIGWGNIRIIKPYIGGGFGNKQEVLYEPLNAWLTTQVGGRCVKLDITREETFQNTRSRHPIGITIEAAIRPNDMRVMARKTRSVSNQGGYASHGHAIVANCATEMRQIYPDALAHQAEAFTVYTNIAAPGAMRGYGIPQGCFAIECFMDDVAKEMGWDPYELRAKNIMPLGYVDPTNGITCYSTGLKECMEKGREFIHWDELREKYKNQTGAIRRGVGMAVFSYKTGVYPISLETSSARMIFNQDGTIQLQLGATEIGQGGDTVFCQMAAQAVGIPTEDVHIVSTQDTDTAPFDTGAYASRQTYVTGMAIKKCGELLKSRILDYAAEVLDKDIHKLDIKGRAVVDRTGKVLRSLEEIGMEAFYSLTHSVHITAEVTNQCKDNTFAFGCCFAEVEVDIPVGKVKVLNIVNVHDSGVLINPKLAEAQVHGGMSMGLGYALSEDMKFDAKTGALLNGNLLDYKLPTTMDTPELHALFVETVDPSGPFGNKALGEPPAIPVAPAIRNAVLQCTGVAIDTLPLNPQKLVEKFAEGGLI